jgi:RNA polymerase sigma factor (sigma-70 family)
MNLDASDHDLLQAYVRERSQPAFAELVRRYIDLVYSAARRQVAGEHAAQDIAQSVFTDLAHHASRITRTQPLAPWLYVVTRRTAIDYLRRESRRAERERSAAEVAFMSEPESDWSRLAPALDEAMATLEERDRAAIVLRYFQNRSLRDVGAALGLSDDSAQKRVSRALDKLRHSFAARGIAVTAPGLATAVSARAVQTAPAAIVGAISVVAPVAVGGFAGAVAGALARKVALSALAAAVVGGAVVEIHRHQRQRAELAALQQEERTLSARIEALRRERESSARRREEIEARLARRQSESPAVELDAEVAAWFSRVTRLKQLAAESPQWSVPELRLLTDGHWFDLARDAVFDTDAERRGLLKALRDAARAIVGLRLRRALVAYLDDHAGVLPETVDALAGYLSPPLDRDILARYQMNAHGNVAACDREAWLIVERTVVDEPFGSRLGVGRAKYETLNATEVPKAEFRRAVQAYVAAHAGELPKSPTDVMPYFAEPLSPVTRDAFLKKPTADFSPATLGRLITPN